MRLAFLLVVSIPSSIFVSTFKSPHSLADTILFNAPRAPSGMEWVNSVLASFCPVRDALSVSLMLRYRKFPYQKIYESIEESPERQDRLFENLFNPTNENNSHETFFSPRKLQRNLVLARKIFIETESVAYKGRFFAPRLYFGFDNVYEKDKNLAMAMLRLCITEQMGMANDLVWLEYFLRIADENHVREIFQLFLDCHEMTPEIFGTFADPWNRMGRTSLINDYLDPDPNLSRDELLMRCALLLSSAQRSEILVKCKGLDPRNSLDEFKETALERGDRQSISILFYHELQHQQQKDNLRVSEMLDYVKLGELSPATTGSFIRGAFCVGLEVGDWPLEHLLPHLPKTYLQMPKEERLSAWLCSDALMYEDTIAISLDNLYDRPGDMPINMRLTKPVEMKDGWVVIRVAEYYILNARAILDTYRSDQQIRKVISIEDSRKIFVGILYALAERQYLDFSDTELEMREDDEQWNWTKHIAEYKNYEYAAKKVMEYLKPSEIYEYAHRASPAQDEEVNKVVKGIAELSIAS